MRTKYPDFAQHVRRYRRDPLLRSIAIVAARVELAERAGGPSGVRDFVRDFSLAGVARTALIAANNFRSADATVGDIERLCSLYIDVDDPDVDNEPGGVRFSQLLVKIAHEQFGSQLSSFENLGRSVLLLDRFSEGVPGAPSAADWETALGLPLDAFMRTGFALFTAAMQNPGAVTRTLLTAPHVMPIFAPLTPEQLLRLVDKHFAASPSELAAYGRRFEQRHREKWSPNPLQWRPLVAVDDELIIPAPHFLLERITPTSLYFTGLEAFGTTFTDALGTAFEQYVGAQLRRLSASTVHSEIEYGPDNKLSCDYILVFPEAIVLVEVKTARPVLDFRTGKSDGFADAKKKIAKARDQLRTTAHLLADDQPEFSHIPKDRPVCRVVVTLEPFYLSKTLSDEAIFEDGDTVAVASAHDLEVVVGALADRNDAGGRLLAALAGPSDRPLDIIDAMRDIDDPPRNQLVDEAWGQWSVWPSAAELEADAG
jgi:hypothetical protein